MFDFVETEPQDAIIKVIGVGGAGGNAVKHMLTAKVKGVEFIAANTDAQALNSIGASMLIQLGKSITRGLGAGANPEIGREAALEDREAIKEALQGADMAFITAGMGGGTGTGAAPVVAEIAKEMGILTVSVVTKPFSFERRNVVAEEGIAALKRHSDSLIVIPNENLQAVLGEQVTLLDAFAQANDVLLGAVRGIADLIMRPGMMNVDFADVRTVMSEMGLAMMGAGEASGQNRARDATEAAISSPLLESVNLEEARGVLVNISASSEVGIGEFNAIGDIFNGITSKTATVITGSVIDDSLGDSLKITVIATGICQEDFREEGKQRLDSEVKPDTLSAEPVTFEVSDEAPRDEVAQNHEAESIVASPADMELSDFSNIELLNVPSFIRRQAD